MADIAEIGFRADTSELVDAKNKLEALSPAAVTATKASDMLMDTLGATGSAASKAATGIESSSVASQAATGSFSRAAGATKNLVSGLVEIDAASNAAAAGASKVGAAVSGVTAPMTKFTVAVNDNAHAHQAMSTQAMAMQHSMRSSLEMLAMGIPPTQILASQMNHLTYAMSGEGGLKGAAVALGTSLKGLLNPVNLLGVGIFGLSIVLLTLVNWAKLAKLALNEFADVLPTIAPYLVTIGAVLAIAFGPTIVASIWAVAGAIVDGLMAAIIAIVATIGAVPILIAAVVAGLFIFRDEIKGVLGVDLIELIKGAINGMIGGFIGGYRAIVAVWGNLPAAFGDLAVQAGNALIAGIESAVNYVSAKVEGFYNSIADLSGGLVSKVKIDAIELPKLNNPNAGAAAGVLADAATAAKSAAGVDYVGAAYDFVGNMAEKAAGKVRGLANAIDLTDASKKKAKGGKTEVEKFDDIVNGAERSIASLQAERDAIGLSEIATAKLKYETQLLNEAKQKNISLSPAQRDTLMGLASDMASLEVQTKKVKEAFEFAKDLTKGFFTDFEQGIVNGEGFWKSFGNAALNALNKIVDKLLNDVIDALFQVNSAAAGGSGGGFLGMLGSIFGSVFGGGGSSSLALPDVGPIPTSRPFAKGGDFTNSIVSRSTPFSFANGTALGEMGEAGPEAIMPLKRMGNGDMGVAAIMPANGVANQNGGAARPGTLNVNVSGARGNAEIQQMVKEGVEAGLDQYDTYALPARVNQIAADPRNR